MSASPFLLVSALLGDVCAMASPLACRRGCSGAVVDVEVLSHCVVVGCSGVEVFVPQSTGSGCGSVFLCRVVEGCVVLQVGWWSALEGQLVHFRGRHGCPAPVRPGGSGRRGARPASYWGPGPGLRTEMGPCAGHAAGPGKIPPKGEAGEEAKGDRRRNRRRSLPTNPTSQTQPLPSGSPGTNRPGWGGAASASASASDSRRPRVPVPVRGLGEGGTPGGRTWCKAPVAPRGALAQQGGRRGATCGVRTQAR